MAESEDENSPVEKQHGHQGGVPLVQITRNGKTNIREFTTKIDSLHERIDFVAPVDDEKMYICFQALTQSYQKVTLIQLCRTTKRSIDDIAKEGGSPIQQR